MTKRKQSGRERTPCRPYDLPHGEHDFLHGQCGRCGEVQKQAVRAGRRK